MPTRASRAGLLVAVAAVLISACGPPSVEELTFSVVRIEALPCGRTGFGSGTVVGDDLVVTNAHIVAGSNDDVTVRTWDDRVHEGLVVGFDDERDLALIRVAGLDALAVDFGEPEEGMVANIIARPRGLDVEVIETTVTRLFNATGDDIYGERDGDVSRRAIELSADVTPGVSGGGVFNTSGELLGLVFAESRRRELTSYAVDVSEVREFLDETDVGIPADTLRCR